MLEQLDTVLDRGIFYPMDEFYQAVGAALPDVVRVLGADVPQPYQRLLVHGRDMTPTLTEAHGEPLQLRILQLKVTESVVLRQIVLVIKATGRPVVFAAIKIYLHQFAEVPRALILEGKQAFGAILQTQAITHASHPQGFFRVTADDIIRDALQISAEAQLYGRYSAMLDAVQQPLAHVLEIIPPFSRDDGYISSGVLSGEGVSR